MSEWCPRCQKRVPVRTRQLDDAAKRERRVETVCAECGILLTARTEALEPPQPR